MKSSRTKKPAAKKASPKSVAKKKAASARSAADEIAAYAAKQAPARRALCDALRREIDAALPQTTSKVWHGAPVWFVGENPVVGYDAMKAGVRLLFWNGRAFGDPALEPVGKYGAAHRVYADGAAIDAPSVRRWLARAGTDVFDSVAFFNAQRRK